MAGTNLTAAHESIANLKSVLTDDSGLIIFAVCTGTPDTTASVYQHGAILVRTDSGTGSNGVYQNTGSTASPVWTLFDTGTAFSLPTSATDSTTTTGTSLNLTQNTVTSGTGLLQSLNGLTTGFGQSLAHTTSVIANGGSMMNISSTGVDTSTTTGCLLNLSSTASTAGTQVLGTFSGLTTGIGVSLVANSTTTGTVAAISATGLTTGQALSTTTSSASTSGSNSVEPVLFSNTMTGVGGVGGRVRAYMTTNVALGGWSNAFKGEVVYGASGRTTGLGSSILAEMTMSAGTTSGTYAPLEIELDLGSNSPVGTDTSFIYASANGTPTNFLATGHLMSFQGLGSASAATNIFHTTGTVSATHGLRINIGGVDYDILLKASTYA